MQKRQRFNALFTKANILAMLGFACFVAWCQIELIALFPPSAGMACSPLFIACVAPWLIVVVLLSRLRNYVIKSPRRVSALALGAMTLASVVTYLGLTGYLLGFIAAHVCAVLIGIALALGYLVWSILFCNLDAKLLLGVALCSLVLVGLLDLCVGSVDAGIMGLISLLLVAGVAVVLFVGETHFGVPEAEQTPTAGTAPDSSDVHADNFVALSLAAIKPYRRFSIAYLLYTFVFGITFGVSAFSDSNTSNEVIASFAPSLAVGAAALLIAWILFGSKTFGLKAIGNIISPLLVVFYILYLVTSGDILMAVVDYTFSLWWLTAVFLVLVAATIVSTIRLPMRLGVSAFFLSSFSTVFALGILFGQAATFFFGHEGITPIVITGLSVIVVMAATSLQIGAKTPLDRSVMNTAATEQGSRVETADSLNVVCERIAQKKKLTPREEEVLLLLAQGHTRNSIAKKLYVSDNTVRAHTKSLYSKLHIHSKQELIDIIDAQRNREV